MRILFVTARPPWPGRRGDQARVAGLAQRLSAFHDVRIVCQCWPGFQTADPPPGIGLTTVPVRRWQLARALLTRRQRPVQVALHDQRHFHVAVAQERRVFQPDVAVVVLSRLGDALEALGDMPVVLDLVDALSLNMAQRSHRERLLSRFWRWEARRMARWDRRLLRQVDLATVVSERDRRVLVGSDDTLARRVRVVPFGLQTWQRDPMATARHPVVVLTGNLGYFPTVDGARWFARRVWPRIRQAMPTAQWWLAGARPHPVIQRLADRDGIRVLANPEDLGSIRRQAAVSVAPLRSGSGTPIKILEAMAEGVPVVTTVSGRSGLDDLPQEAILTANTGENFARAVIRLLEEPDLAYQTASVAKRWLLGRHDLDKVADLFEHQLRQVLRARHGDDDTLPLYDETETLLDDTEPMDD